MAGPSTAAASGTQASLQGGLSHHTDAFSRRVYPAEGKSGYLLHLTCGDPALESPDQARGFT